MIPQVDDAGRIVCTIAVPPQVGDAFVNGMCYDSTGCLYITPTPTGLDIQVAGKRVTPLGQLVYAAYAANGPYVNGLPVANDGAVMATATPTPAAIDPFVRGIRVEAAGGVFFISGPPLQATAPAIIGTPQNGIASSYTPGAAAGSPTPVFVSRLWLLDAISTGITTPTFTPGAGDIGKTLTVQEVWGNFRGNITLTSAGVVVIA